VLTSCSTSCSMVLVMYVCNAHIDERTAPICGLQFVSHEEINFGSIIPRGGLVCRFELVAPISRLTALSVE
jgi:hypothetical protein